jgi:hypothetical protein
VLRQALEAIEAAKQPTAAQYRHLFDLFPERFAEDRFNESFAQILAGDRREWNSGQDYRLRMCQAYQFVDHKIYMRKLLNIGVEANNWGGRDHDEQLMHVPGDMYKRLVFGEECQQLTQESLGARLAVILDALGDYADRQIEAVYDSLAWDGMDRFGVECLLDGLCAHSSQRCQLTRALRNKYLKDPLINRHTH